MPWCWATLLRLQQPRGQLQLLKLLLLLLLC
jgi:hypothetical protein